MMDCDISWWPWLTLAALKEVQVPVPDGNEANSMATTAAYSPNSSNWRHVRNDKQQQKRWHGKHKPPEAAWPCLTTFYVFDTVWICLIMFACCSQFNTSKVIRLLKLLHPFWTFARPCFQNQGFSHGSMAPCHHPCSHPAGHRRVFLKWDPKPVLTAHGSLAEWPLMGPGTLQMCFMAWFWMAQRPFE